LIPLVVVVPPPFWTIVMVSTPARSRSCARLSRNAALVQPCTPARTCTNKRGQGRAFGPSLFPLRRTLPRDCPFLLAAPPWLSLYRFSSCTRP
jgi:hypothetical protein